MRVKPILLLLIACSIFESSFGQDEESLDEDTVKIERITLPRATIKINIPAMTIDPKQSVFFATDTRIGRFLSLDMGAGPYFNSWAYNEYKGESIRGIRARLGVKYYYIFGRRLAPYVGVEGMFNRYALKNYREVCRSGCQYTEDMLVTQETLARGLSARTGLEIFLGKEKRFFFDAYGGVGFKVTDRSMNLPEDAVFSNSLSGFFGFDTQDNANDTLPNIILGIYFGYAFW